MADLYSEWKSDLQFTPGGDLQIADGHVLAEQRIIRRLLTAVRSYVWHQDYGAGLPQKIGHLGNVQIIQSIISANIALEAAVATVPPPKITVVQDSNTRGLFIITIVYTDANFGEQITLSFDTTGASQTSPLYLG